MVLKLKELAVARGLASRLRLKPRTSCSGSVSTHRRQGIGFSPEIETGLSIIERCKTGRRQGIGFSPEIETYSALDGV